MVLLLLPGDEQPSLVVQTVLFRHFLFSLCQIQPLFIFARSVVPTGAATKKHIMFLRLSLPFAYCMYLACYVKRSCRTTSIV